MTKFYYTSNISGEFEEWKPISDFGISYVTLRAIDIFLTLVGILI